MANIKPLLDKVLVKVDKPEETTRTGIILAGKKDQPCVATVVARGPGGVVDGKEIKMCVEAGDKIIINDYSGSKITYDGQEYTILSQRDILALIT